MLYRKVLLLVLAILTGVSAVSYAANDPAMGIEGNSVAITNGDNTPDTGDHTDFDGVDIGNTFDRIFTITNTGEPGEGDMVCWSAVRIYIDGVYTLLDSVMLK